MPNYDYECQKCGKIFEVFQSMNDARLEKCLDEACDGTMKRLIGTGAGVIFKGSGFYATDYRSQSYQAGAKSEASSSESGSSGGDSSGGSSGGKESSSGGGDSGTGSSGSGSTSPAKPASSGGDASA